MTVELALAALARGEFRFSDAEVDGATISLVARRCRRNPDAARERARVSQRETRLDRLRIRRSALVWREPGKRPVTLSPIAAEVSAVSLAGPWRFEGEVAGASLRVTTGELEEGGRLRTKAFLTGEDLQLNFDGSLVLPIGAGSCRRRARWRLRVSRRAGPSRSRGGSGAAAASSISPGSRSISPAAPRGWRARASILPGRGTGSLALRARRLDADALMAALAERQGFERALQGLPGTVDVGLDLDQVIWRGEDFSGFALRGRLHDGGLSDASASVRVAGALAGASGSINADGASGRINLKAEDARRVALVLARAGLDPALADFVAGFGRIDADALGSWAGERATFQRLLVVGSSGLRLDASGEAGPDRLAAKATVSGLDARQPCRRARVSLACSGSATSRST